MIKTKGALDVALIDFGLAYRPSTLRQQSSTNEQDGAFGTLSYASLYAHEHSCKIIFICNISFYLTESPLDLSYRDDLESLTYTIIRLFKGNLPWSYFSDHGNHRGRIRQVHEQKKAYSGQRLSSEVPILGALVDYARSLPTGVVPDYEAWRDRLRRCTWHGGPIQPWRAQRVITGEV